MWKVESEKYDEEFELMKKDFEVAYPPKYRVHPHLTLDRVRHPLTQLELPLSVNYLQLWGSHLICHLQGFQQK